MTQIQRILDTTMSCLWILTYTLTWIGTIRYKYPLIAPMTQAIVAPYEFAMLYRIIIKGDFGLDYVSMAYLYWTFIELAILYVMVKKQYVPKEQAVPYLKFVGILTVVMCYLVAYQNHVFFFSYFNSFIGDVYWVFHITKEDYPMKPLSLMVFLAKFLADVILPPVYFGMGPLLIDILCILLPILDFLFIVIYFYRKWQMRTRRTRSGERV